MKIYFKHQKYSSFSLRTELLFTICIRTPSIRGSRRNKCCINRLIQHQNMHFLCIIDGVSIVLKALLNLNFVFILALPIERDILWSRKQSEVVLQVCERPAAITLVSPRFSHILCSMRQKQARSSMPYLKIGRLVLAHFLRQKGPHWAKIDS